MILFARHESWLCSIDISFQNLSDPDQLIFEDIATSLSNVTATVFGHVQSVIAIGSGNHQIAKNILDKIDKVKLVMYSDSPGDDSELKTYPEEYPSGKGKYIAFSPAMKYGGAIGILNFTVDVNGNFKLSSSTGSNLVYIGKNGSKVNDDAKKFVEDLESSTAMKDAKKPVRHWL